MTHQRKTLPKGIRFVLVGITNTLIDFCLFFVLTSQLGTPFVWANMISTSAALTFSFVLNRTYTFNATGNPWTQILRFLAFTLFGLWIIQPVVIWTVLLISWPIPSNLALLGAKLIATVCSMVWNYLTYDNFVFTKNKQEDNDDQRSDERS